MSLLSIRDLVKSYPAKTGGVNEVVSIAEFDLEAGQQIALRGRSGLEKTTLLNLIAGITAADSGSIELDGTDISGLSQSKRDRHRAEKIGYVFQSFNLLGGYSCIENVELGMSFGAGVDKLFAKELLVKVGLEDRLDYNPSELSIGQQQRVAVARALANRPKLVLADEPTGNLDLENATAALALIRDLCRENGAALILVSHDPVIVSQFERVIELADLNRASSNEVGGAA